MPVISGLGADAVFTRTVELLNPENVLPPAPRIEVCHEFDEPIAVWLVDRPLVELDFEPPY